MSTQMQNTFVFRWRSLFGFAVALFVLYGAANISLGTRRTGFAASGWRWRGSRRDTGAERDGRR